MSATSAAVLHLSTSKSLSSSSNARHPIVPRSPDHSFSTASALFATVALLFVPQGQFPFSHACISKRTNDLKKKIPLIEFIKMQMPLICLLLPFSVLADSLTDGDSLFLNDELPPDSYVSSDLLPNESIDDGLFALGGEPTNLNTDPNTDQFLMSDVGSIPDSCLSLSTGARIRAREEGICKNTLNEQPASQGVATDIATQYWCSATSVLGIQTIPVCNYGDGMDTKVKSDDLGELGSVILYKCQISKSRPFAFRGLIQESPG